MEENVFEVAASWPIDVVNLKEVSVRIMVIVAERKKVTVLMSLTSMRSSSHKSNATTSTSSRALCEAFEPLTSKRGSHEGVDVLEFGPL